MNTIYNDADEIEAVYISHNEPNFTIYLINAIDDIDEHQFYGITNANEFFIIWKQQGADMVTIHYNDVETISVTEEHMMFTLKNQLHISVSFFKPQFLIF